MVASNAMIGHSNKRVLKQASLNFPTHDKTTFITHINNIRIPKLILAKTVAKFTIENLQLVIISIKLMRKLHMNECKSLK